MTPDEAIFCKVLQLAERMTDAPPRIVVTVERDPKLSSAWRQDKWTVSLEGIATNVEGGTLQEALIALGKRMEAALQLRVLGDSEALALFQKGKVPDGVGLPANSSGGQPKLG